MSNDTQTLPLTDTERDALAQAIERDLAGLSLLDQSGGGDARWLGWFLTSKGAPQMIRQIERILADRLGR